MRIFRNQGNRAANPLRTPLHEEHRDKDRTVDSLGNLGRVMVKPPSARLEKAASRLSFLV